MIAMALVRWCIGAAWGAALAWPLARRATRVDVAARAATLSITPRAATPARRSWGPLTRVRDGDGAIRRVVGSLLARRGARAADRALARELFKELIEIDRETAI